MKTNKTEQIN